MKNTFFLYVAFLCFTLQSCQRPVGYFQRTPHVAARLPVGQMPDPSAFAQPDSVRLEITADPVLTGVTDSLTLVNAVASLVPKHTPNERVLRRMQHMEHVLLTPVQATDKQPRPKPKKQLKLGNRIRESLGMPLRKELNWWQRISWKIKASVIVIVVALLFAILHVTILAIIFGVLGAFLLITGLKRSFKVRRPWF